MMSVKFVVVIIAAVQIVQEHQTAQHMQISVVLVMPIALMIVYRTVLELGVAV